MSGETTSNGKPILLNRATLAAELDASISDGCGPVFIAFLTEIPLTLYHCTIMSGHLPERVAVADFAEKHRRISGDLPIRGLDRLADCLLSIEGNVAIELDFAREGRWPIITGHVNADLVLQCQCCLHSLTWPVRAEVRLGAVDSLDQAARLPDSLEPLLTEGDGEVVIADIVQDELLLAIPDIPRHEQCELPTTSETNKRATHPFGVLAQLKDQLPK